MDAAYRAGPIDLSALPPHRVAWLRPRRSGWDLDMANITFFASSPAHCQQSIDVFGNDSTDHVFLRWSGRVDSNHRHSVPRRSFLAELRPDVGAARRIRTDNLPLTGRLLCR